MAVAVPRPPAEVDPFLDTEFAPLDTRDRAQHIAELGRIAEQHPELQTDLEQEPVPGTPAPPSSVEDQPEVFDVDGGTVTISHDSKGWHGELELEDGGGTEAFHGKTQKELIAKVLTGKLNATKQVRKLNKKLKLGTPVEGSITPVQEQTFEAKQLNANDIFEIKTALEADPDKAFDLRFQKKYGMSEAEFVSLVQELRISSRKGEEAYDELTIEGVSKAFLENHKDGYYPWAENGQAIAHWLCKNKLRRNPRKNEDFGSISGELLKQGLYTIDNLEEAFEDLNDSGLLLPPPQPELLEETEEIEEQAPVPSAPVPAVPQNPRIVSTRRQSRGGLGLRQNAAVGHQAEEPRAPSADELENMSTQELSELLNATYRHARSARR